MRLFLLCIFLLTSSAHAWNSDGGTNYFTAEQLHHKDFLGKIFPDKPKHVAEYRGYVDRTVFQGDVYKYDPEVLISSPRVEPTVVKEPEVIEKVIYVYAKEDKKKKDVIVKTQWCDEDSCGEWEVQ